MRWRYLFGLFFFLSFSYEAQASFVCWKSADGCSCPSGYACRDGQGGAAIYTDPVSDFCNTSVDKYHNGTKSCMPLADDCGAGFEEVTDNYNTGQLCQEVPPPACMVGEISASCPAVQCNPGSVGWGQTCPPVGAAADLPGEACITSGLPHECDSGAAPNAGNGTSNSEPGDQYDPNDPYGFTKKLTCNPGTTGCAGSNVSPGSNGAQFGGTSGSSGSGATSPSGEAFVPAGGSNTPISDFCVAFPDSVQCSGWEVEKVIDICDHGGAPDPVIGCDYLPPEIQCPSGQYPGSSGECETPPSLNQPVPPENYQPPTEPPPTTYPTPEQPSNSGGDSGSGGSGEVTVNVEFPEPDYGTRPDISGMHETGDKTYASVMSDFSSRLQSASVVTSVSNFFTLSGVGGSCPVWSVDAWIFTITFDHLCQDFIPWSLISGVITVVSLLFAARVALG